MHETIIVGKHTFTLVDFIPAGYEIWNIGHNMPDGYLPLCQVDRSQMFSVSETVRTDTLKAIPLKDAQVILRAIGCGTNTIPKMEAYLKKHKDPKPGSYEYAQVQRIEKALPIMRQIKWS